MAKLFSSPSEANALRSMCSKDLQISGMLISQLAEDYFYTDEGKEAYNRILNQFNRRGEVPSYKLLCEDLGLSEDTREFLRSAEGVAKSPGQVTQLMESLNTYRMTRLYYGMAKKILSHLEQSKINPEELSGMVSKSVSRIQLRKGADAEIIRIGKDSNLKEVLAKLLYEEDDNHIIPTGFRTFDSVNGGFLRGSLVVIGGSSGAGKCLTPDALIHTGIKLEFPDGFSWSLDIHSHVDQVITSTRSNPVHVEHVTVGMRIRCGTKARMVTGISAATTPLGEFAEQAVRTLDYKDHSRNILSLLQAGAGDLSPEQIKTINETHRVTLHPHPQYPGRIDALTLPLKVKVLTREGVRTTNGLYITRAMTRRLHLRNGQSIEGTLTHKMLLYSELLRAASDWKTIGQLNVGDKLMGAEGDPVEIWKIEEVADPHRLVMDICVPGPHEYMANGVVSHNSILANQLNINQSAIGYKTTLVPLEMSGMEMVSRTTSTVTGTDGISIMLKRLATEERDQVYRKMMRFNRKTAEANGQYTIYKPKEDVSIEELMSSLAAIPSDIIYVDYISLLRDTDGDDQWKKLGAIARFCKIQADSMNKVIVLLAQVSEEGKLKYSQTIKEHASLAWIFVATKESRERGYLNIDMLKSRNQVKKPFTLRIDYAKTAVTDLSPEELERLEQAPEQEAPPSRGKRRSSVGANGAQEVEIPARGKKAKEGSSSDYTPDLSE